MIPNLSGQPVMNSKTLSVTGLIPSFQLQAINRDAVISPWDYKQRKSLAILFFHDATCTACCNLLLNIAQHYSAYRTCDTEVLAIATNNQPNTIPLLKQFAEQHAIPFPILLDHQKTVRQAYLGMVADPSAVGVFICDRYGELYMQAVEPEANQLPAEAEIRGWVEFVDMQCPECFPPSWR